MQNFKPMLVSLWLVLLPGCGSLADFPPGTGSPVTRISGPAMARVNGEELLRRVGQYRSKLYPESRPAPIVIDRLNDAPLASNALLQQRVGPIVEYAVAHYLAPHAQVITQTSLRGEGDTYLRGGLGSNLSVALQSQLQQLNLYQALIANEAQRLERSRIENRPAAEQEALAKRVAALNSRVEVTIADIERLNDAMRRAVVQLPQELDLRGRRVNLRVQVTLFDQTVARQRRSLNIRPLISWRGKEVEPSIDLQREHEVGGLQVMAQLINEDGVVIPGCAAHVDVMIERSERQDGVRLLVIASAGEWVASSLRVTGVQSATQEGVYLALASCFSKFWGVPVDRLTNKPGLFSQEDALSFYQAMESLQDGTVIRQIQRWLTQAGYGNLQETGTFDGPTRRAAAVLCTNMGLPVTTAPTYLLWSAAQAAMLERFPLEGKSPTSQVSSRHP